ncbi:MAG TPA: hypothetical protein VHJ19_08115, partial [Gammaproteobacteria bacterium]|nr:hypothetical protein [Gammaproteobacteria bacterium]
MGTLYQDRHHRWVYLFTEGSSHAKKLLGVAAAFCKGINPAMMAILIHGAHYYQCSSVLSFSVRIHNARV